MIIETCSASRCTLERKQSGDSVNRANVLGILPVQTIYQEVEKEEIDQADKCGWTGRDVELF